MFDRLTRDHALQAAWGAVGATVIGSLLHLPIMREAFDVVHAETTRATAAQVFSWALFGALLPALFRLYDRAHERPRSARTYAVLFSSTFALAVACEVVAELLGGTLDGTKHLVDDGLTVRLVICLAAFQFAGARRKHVEVIAREQRAAELRAQLGTAQLDLLRTQLNPHFLFNALNSVASLAASRSRDAADMLQRLRSLLVASFLPKQPHLVTVEEEVAITKTYLEIEHVRLGARLRSNIEMAEDARRARVPTALLQTLADNAIRHGIAPRISGGTVSVGALRAGRHLRLTVEDDGVGLKDGTLTERIGLRNTRLRLQHLYGADQRMVVGRSSGGGVRVEITIPFEIEAPA
jgi:two-component system sensor histidine kinase AlgZ